MAITKGFNHDIEFYAESTFGGGLYNPAVADYMWAVSDAVRSVTLTANNNAEVIFTIGDYDGQDTVTKTKDYVLRVEYVMQKPDTQSESLLYNAIHRTSGDLQSLTFLVTQDDTTYYELKGCMASNVEIKCDIGEPVIVTQEYIVKDVANPTTTDPLAALTNLSHAQAIGNSYATFSGASITYNAATIGFGTRSFTATINNNVDRVHTIGSAVAASLPEGKQDITGSVDVYIAKDQSSDEQFLWVKSPTDGRSIVINTGSTGFDKLTFSNVYFSQIEIPLNNTDGAVVSGLPWTAESVALATV